MAKDLADVINQMASRGISPPPGLDLSGALQGYVRFRPDGDKRAKKSAWVRLFEYRSPRTSQCYITGVFGNRGDRYEVEATRADWSPADRAAEMAARKEAAKAAEAERAKDAATAAEKARRMWQRSRPVDGLAHPYLERKSVGAYGLRVGFNGRLLVPLRDVQGALHGLQYIADDGTKLFGTGTVKEGRSHLLGEIREGVPLAFGEGYATCASAHMATAWPVVCCFDAGNLYAVMSEYRRLYPELPFVVLADDDRHLLPRLAERLARHGIQCPPDELREQGLQREWQIPDGPLVRLRAGWKDDAARVMRIEGAIEVGGQAHMLLLENAGQAKAHAAARKFKARVLTPAFGAGAAAATDWNDLHVAEGLPAVREQLLAGLEAPAPDKPRANARAPRAARSGADQAAEDAAAARGSEGDFLERFTLIYGTTTVWDSHTREILRVESLKLAYGKRIDWWLSQPDRKMVPQSHVVFDPACTLQPPQYVNLFDRLPLTPLDAPDKCARIVEHWWQLCQENDALFHWVMCWLAYPLQHPGAKMRTALILHGRTEGTGKSLAGAIMRAIYGRYCASVGQAELQRDFNDWLSAKLLILAEEVVSRQELTHLQGALQALITQPTVQINVKNMPIREEANQAQFIFFSNQQVPVKLNPRDRRYTVIRVEEERPPEYFEAIQAELQGQGAEAFYHYLLAYDLKGFNEFSRPFDNRDRMHLITLGMSPDQRFFEYWRNGLAGVPFCTCSAGDLYAAFKAWCRVNGERFVPSATAFGRTMTEELERLRAPPKRTVRYDAWSDKDVSEGSFDAAMTTRRQGIVYFVPAESEALGPRIEGEFRPPPEAGVDVTGTEYASKKIRVFQEQLHELMASAKRAM